MVVLHSHPGGYADFSETDDTVDTDLFDGIHGWIDGHDPHGSVIMLPDGRMFGRVHHTSGATSPLARITVAGDDLQVFSDHTRRSPGDEADSSHRQAFGDGTLAILEGLSIAVVGCSGTGSYVIEMLGRLGVRRLVLIDPDVVERRNLNRIVSAAALDARTNRQKVDVLADAVRNMELGTDIVPMATTLLTPRAVLAARECDILFGCVDGPEGRHVLNRIASHYNLPLIDIGTRIDPDGDGSVDDAVVALHYVQPGGSSLLSRRAYTLEQVEAEGLQRTDPDEYDRRVRQGYITGVAVDRPAVVSLNGLVASMAINELLARIHGYRFSGSAAHAQTKVSIAFGDTVYSHDGDPCPRFSEFVGLGDRVPLLGMPALDGTNAA